MRDIAIDLPSRQTRKISGGEIGGLDLGEVGLKVEWFGARAGNVFRQMLQSLEPSASYVQMPEAPGSASSASSSFADRSSRSSWLALSSPISSIWVKRLTSPLSSRMAAT